MPLFERSNKVTVVTEIERNLRTFEAKGKTAQINNSYDTSTEIERLVHAALLNNDITPEQSEDYRLRIETALKDFERLERTETRDIVNDFENPREIAARYRGLDNYKAEIESERANELKTEKCSEGRDKTTQSVDERVI